MADQVPNDQSTAILKELSDIKSSLAVNTTETANIKLSITEIKGDIKDIKNDTVTRRELSDALKGRDDEAKAYYKKVATLWDWRWMIIGGLTILSFLASIIGKKFFG